MSPTTGIPERLLDDFIKLQDEFSKYSELTEKEVAIMKTLSKSIKVLQRSVDEVIPLTPQVVARIFPRVKEVSLRKDGTVEVIEKRGMRATVRLDEFPPQVFVAVAKDAVARLNEIVEERYARKVRIREMIQVDFVINQVSKYHLYKTKSAALLVRNRTKSAIRVTLSVMKEGDWAVFKQLELGSDQETGIDLSVLKILESPLSTRFQLGLRDAEGDDYHETFTLGPIPPQTDELRQPIVDHYS